MKMSPPSSLFFFVAASIGTAMAFQSRSTSFIPSLTSSQRSRGCHHTYANIAASRKLPLIRPFPLLSTTQDAEIVVEDEEMYNEDDWIPDRQRISHINSDAGGELIHFDPTNPKTRPLKSAAAYPSDLYDHDHENYFKRRPTKNNKKKTKTSKTDERADDDIDNYFSRRASLPPPSYQQRRKVSSVYTQEEELITSLGGKHHIGALHDEWFDGPSSNGFREEGYLGDSTLKEIAMDYSVPICYLADVIASWGVPVPIDPLGRLGDMVTGEQAFAILEAIHTLDIAALHERYSEDNMMNICDYYDIDLKEAFEFAMRRGWALPFGVRTFLRVEQEEELLEALGRDIY